MPTSRTRVLLCGAGNMGRNHLRVLGTLPECEVAGVVEPDPKAASAVTEAPVYDSLARALDSARPDAVVLATPTQSHHALAQTLIDRRIPFLVEKPVATSVADGAAMAERAGREGVPCMVGHVERFNPAVVAIRRLVQDGQLGQIVHVGARRVGGTPQDARKAGDVLIDLAVHDIDIAQWLLGPLELKGSIGRHLQHVDCATMLFVAGDITVDIHVNWITPVKIRSLTVTGTEAHLEANLITQQVTLTRKNPVLASGEPSGNRFFDDYLLSFAVPDQIQVGILKREPLREELRAFVAALHEADPASAMPIPLEQGVSALGLAERARTLLVAARSSESVI